MRLQSLAGVCEIGGGMLASPGEVPVSAQVIVVYEFGRIRRV